MRFSSVFVGLAAFFVVFVIFQGSAVAEQKKTFKQHWRGVTKMLSRPSSVEHFKRPLLNEAKLPLNNQYDNDGWSPEIWADNAGGVEVLMDDFRTADVITDQYEDDGVPVLEVGEGFLKLSAQDKDRVVRFVDYASQITASSPNGMFHIVLDGWRHVPVGVYTKNGLQLQ